MNAQNKHIYEFGSFQLDTAEHTLLHDGKIVSLTPKVFDTLLILIENNGHLVEKDELMERVWEDTIVEEANLAKNISILRKTLSNDGLGDSFIETVPKRGYRFTAEVKEVEINESSEKIPQTGSPLGVIYPLAQLGKARATKDKREYEKFFEWWKDADEDLEILIEAKKEYEKLR